MKMRAEEDEEETTRHESIPHELISDILTRLPVKSLTRFRSVSTRWNSTITHPSFSKSHFSRSAATATGDGAAVTLILTFINRFTCERAIFSVTVPPNQTRSDPNPNPNHVLTIPGFPRPFVSQSLQGLICFNVGPMCVCNPSTREYIKLPWTETETPERPSPSPSPSTNFRANAFGFDPLSNAHKVLDTWITSHDDEMTMEHRVFTVGSASNKWRRIADGPPYFPFNERVCINGQIYFRAFTISDKAVMVAFDVNREEFRFIQMVNDWISVWEASVLMEHDGNLAIVDREGHGNGEDGVILMWVLVDEESEKWVKKRVEVPTMYWEINDGRRFRFVGTTFSGEMMFVERSSGKPFHMVFYDLKKSEMRKVEMCGLNHGNGAMNIVSVTEHVESIISLT